MNETQGAEQSWRQFSHSKTPQSTFSRSVLVFIFIYRKSQMSEELPDDATYFCP